ncbi:MAG: threonylcarbamoyl-AMP synthase [Methanosphaera sp.]|nr:threonylcarbamoyl-AMP synthase [Methanosphaera sp.]
MKIIRNLDQKKVMCLIEAMNKKEIIVYPTDTIYGIGAKIYDDDSLEKVYEAKSRPHNKPLSICVHDKSSISDVAITNENINKIIDLLLPGPYTILLNKKDNISDLLTANNSTVAIRIPDNKVCYELTRKFPITSTSANISHMPTYPTIDEIHSQLGDSIDYYIDAGLIRSSRPSTIIDLTSNKPEIIRSGDGNPEVLGKIIDMDIE